VVQKESRRQLTGKQRSKVHPRHNNKEPLPLLCMFTILLLNTLTTPPVSNAFDNCIYVTLLYGSIAYFGLDLPASERHSSNRSMNFCGKAPKSTRRPCWVFSLLNQIYMYILAHNLENITKIIFRG
jgi:hypothetical protein